MANEGNNNGGRGFADNPDLAREAGSEGGSQNTEKQQEARRENIKKAQEARRDQD